MKIITEPNYISFIVEKSMHLIIEPWAQEYNLAEVGMYSIKFEGPTQEKPEFHTDENTLVVFAPPESTYTLYSPTGFAIDANDIRFPAMPTGMTTQSFMTLLGLNNETSDTNSLQE